MRNVTEQAKMVLPRVSSCIKVWTLRSNRQDWWHRGKGRRVPSTQRILYVCISFLFLKYEKKKEKTRAGNVHHSSSHLPSLCQTHSKTHAYSFSLTLYVINADVNPGLLLLRFHSFIYRLIAGVTIQHVLARNAMYCYFHNTFYPQMPAFWHWHW